MTFLIFCLFNLIKVSLCYTNYYGNNGANDLMQKLDFNDYNLKYNEVLNSENALQLDESTSKLHSKFQPPRKLESNHVVQKDNQRGITSFSKKKPVNGQKNETESPTTLILMMRKATWGATCNEEPKGECAFTTDCSRETIIPSKNIDCYNLYPHLDVVCCALQEFGPIPTLSPIPAILSDEVFESDSNKSGSSSDSDSSDSGSKKSRNKSKNDSKRKVSVESYEKWKAGHNKGKKNLKEKTQKDFLITSFEKYHDHDKEEHLNPGHNKNQLDKKAVKDISVLSLETYKKNEDKSSARKRKRTKRKGHRNKYFRQKMKKYRKKHKNLYNMMPIKNGKYMNINNNAKKQDVFIIPSDLMGSDNSDIIKKIVILKKSKKYNLAEKSESEISLSSY